MNLLLNIKKYDNSCNFKQSNLTITTNHMKFYFSLFISSVLIFFSTPILSDTGANSSTENVSPNVPENKSIDKTLEEIEAQQMWSETFEHESDNFQAKFFNMLFILSLLIGFMILASWALKRMMKSKMSQQNDTSEVKIIETRHLSPRASLHLVEVNNKTFLVGESSSSMTFKEL